MYIMCVCLFSALSRRVGALQISIIIIIINLYALVGGVDSSLRCAVLQVQSNVDTGSGEEKGWGRRVGTVRVSERRNIHLHGYSTKCVASICKIITEFSFGA